MTTLHLHRVRNVVWILSVLLIGSALAQPTEIRYYKGDRLLRYKNYHNGNKVNTVFYNFGLIGNIGEISGEWPTGTGDEYIGDVTPMVGIEFTHPSGEQLHSVITCDGPRGNTDGTSTAGVPWVFEPLPGFAAEPAPGSSGRVAMSHIPSSWPRGWPDKAVTDPHDYHWKRDPQDPGWARQWNGYFGKDQLNADQESYFQMDDQSDNEWFSRMDQDTSDLQKFFYPDTTDSTRRGLGIRVAVRGLQWAHFLAQNCIFWLYDVTNVSTHNYDKVVFGMVVGTLAGGRQDANDDLGWFDITNNITYSYDSDDVGSPGWVPVRPGIRNVGYVAYAFLESPGNGFDGIDNDGDDSTGTAPIFSLTSLNAEIVPRTFTRGVSRLVLINYDTYERQVITYPDTGIPFVVFRGDTVRIYPDSVAYNEQGEKGRNNFDDNFNGIIDERQDHVGKRHADYINNIGTADRMLDERRDDLVDNDGDWNINTDDLGADGKPGTFDEGEGDGRPTSGEPNFDQTDVHESDQIGLTSFNYFVPSSALRMHDDPGIWTRMYPGRFDSVLSRPADGDFVYGSGYFPLRPGQTERFSMALLFGEDLQDVTNTKVTVQRIYNDNYRFAKPPEKPTVHAVPGDGKVTLYWDDIAERSYDAVSGYDFEGYKIYRSTDPGFLESFTVTDGRGRKVFNRPIAQFDLRNDHLGFFPLLANGASYYLGDDIGLQHTWTDTTVENGQTYYYAVCAYDHGDVPKSIFPAETSKSILVDVNGDVTLDRNTVVVRPVAPANGYIPALPNFIEHVSGGGTGHVFARVLDSRQVEPDARYSITFTDSVNTTIGFTMVRTLAGRTDTILLNQRFYNELIDPNDVHQFNAFYEEKFGIAPGSFDAARFFSINVGPVVDGHQLFFLNPRSTSIILEASKWTHTSVVTPLQYSFAPAHYAAAYLSGREWPSDYDITFSDVIADTSMAYDWYPTMPWGLSFPAVPVNFNIYNRTTQRFVQFAFDEANSDDSTGARGRWDPNNVALIFEPTQINGRDTLLLTWALTLRRNAYNQGDRPVAGDVLALRVYLPFSNQDRFEYTLSGQGVSSNAVNLSRIKVYPNPYIAASVQEPANPYSSGRGERRVNFIHLPSTCTIRIYTVRGDLVQTIHHSSTIDDGTESWDLRSKEGLNVAYGVYVYHVDSPFGKHIDKFAVVK